MGETLGFFKSPNPQPLDPAKTGSLTLNTTNGREIREQETHMIEMR